jgi:hypothetical protein
LDGFFKRTVEIAACGVSVSASTKLSCDFGDVESSSTSQRTSDFAGLGFSGEHRNLHGLDAEQFVDKAFGVFVA